MNAQRLFCSKKIVFSFGTKASCYAKYSKNVLNISFDQMDKVTIYPDMKQETFVNLLGYREPNIVHLMR